MKTNEGIITFAGKTLYLQQQAYMHDTTDDCYYRAQAIDDDGNEYFVNWEIIDPYADNEEDACDWNVYEVSRD